MWCAVVYKPQHLCMPSACPLPRLCVLGGGGAGGFCHALIPGVCFRVKVSPLYQGYKFWLKVSPGGSIWIWMCWLRGFSWWDTAMEANPKFENSFFIFWSVTQQWWTHFGTSCRPDFRIYWVTLCSIKSTNVEVFLTSIGVWLWLLPHFCLSGIHAWRPL